MKWKTEKRKISELKPYPGNPRKANEKEVKDLDNSLRKFSVAEPLVINTDNTVIGGNFRLSRLKEKGVKEVDVRVPDRKLTKREADELNLRLNKNQGSWDLDLLMNFDEELLLDVGFDKELEQMWDEELEILDDGFNVEKAIEEIEKPIARTGDIYQLGEHRVMCGDSTKIEDIKKLMNKEKARMVFSDPPYNIGLDYNKGISTEGKYKGKYKKDHLTDSKYKDFIKKTIENVLLFVQKDAHIFYWCDQKYIGTLQDIYRELGINFQRVTLWVKDNFNMTPQIAFNKVYEPCVYGVKGKPYLNKKIRNLNEILNKEVESGVAVHDEILSMIDIWLAKRDNSTEYEHPTQKPLTLAEKPIRRCTEPKDLIIDLFGGSGSTLIAAEQMKRRAFLMEIDPVFVEVIIKRYEQYTNQKAKKLN